jgi:hypothetical protein
VLTTAQLQTLKADLTANAGTVPINGIPTAISAVPHGPDNAAAVAAWYNQPAAPDYYVWRTSVTEAEYVGTSGVDVANGGAATVWSWTGAGFITRAQGERDAWNRLFVSGFANPSLANVRQAFADILSGGTATGPANQNHPPTVSKRKATAAEKLFAAGTGSFGAPATMAFEGSLSYADVINAWAA